MPWDGTAENMQPDSPIPAVAPDPIPVVATNTATGQRVAVDIAGPLRVAIEKAITDVVSQHPSVGIVRDVMRDRVFTDRTMLHGASIDLVAATVAALATILNPGSTFAAAAWVVTAVLASKTLIHAAVIRAMREVA